MPDKAPRESARERRQKQIVSFVGHLLGSVTVQEAATKTGISSRTATRWLRSAEFQRAYVESREATLRSVTQLLRQASVPAVEALARVLRMQDAPQTAVVSAAKAVLDAMTRLTETEELERRLAALEATAGQENQ